MIFPTSQVNCVVMKGLNDDEVVDFVKFTESKVSTAAAILIFL